MMVERGTIKTSAIYVATDEGTSVYRTLQEVPPSLRRKVAELAFRPDTRTLLIADRRGLREFLRARRARVERIRQAAEAAAVPPKRRVRVWRAIRRRRIELLLTAVVVLLIWVLIAVH